MFLELVVGLVVIGGVLALLVSFINTYSDSNGAG